ncbi:putative GTP binding domain, P-loop containing nucleoside triphosphate hydrolase [Helianthus anomalus]
MGGDTASVVHSTIDDDISTALWPAGESYYTILETEANEKHVYQQLLNNYDHLNDRLQNMEAAKTKVLSYTPGSWIENVGGMTMSDYNVPKTTTILLIGPKGSGKSSLVNRISRVFEDDKFAPERAQVSYNSSVRGGTSFLQEYMIPRNSTSFCFYDTSGFSNNLTESLEMIKQWMTKGVRHGESMKSASDSSSQRGRMKCKNGQDKHLTYERRRVDFVIFVVNGLSVLKCMENSGADTQYIHTVTEVFSSPFLSFKDHKPVIAITHGDLLSISERARVGVYLGHLLGVHPSKQTFDVPDNCEPTTELTVIDLVRYALEHADRNLPCKSRLAISKGSTIQLWTHLLLLLVIGLLMFTAHFHGFRSLKLNPEPSLEIKKVMEFDQEIIPEPDLNIKKVTELDTETVSVPNVEIMKATESDQEVVPEPDPEIEKFMEVDQEIISEPHLEIKKAMESDQGGVPKTDPEITKATEFDREIVPELDLEIKKVTEFDQEIVPKPTKKTKKGDADKTLGKNKKSKKVRVPEPILEIDWKTIRHIW